MSGLRSIGVWTGALVFGLDQLSKWIIVHLLNLPVLGAFDVLPPLLTFRMGWNYGINFGFFSSEAETMRWVLITLSLLISGWVIWWLNRKKFDSTLIKISGGLLVGGALGNVVDRLVYGAVADFINMSCCGISNPFVFNIADIAIVAGALGLVFFTPDGQSSDAPPKTR